MLIDHIKQLGRSEGARTPAEVVEDLGTTSTANDVLSGLNLRGKRILVTGVSAGLGAPGIAFAPAMAALTLALTRSGPLSIDALVGPSLSGTLWNIGALLVGFIGGGTALFEWRKTPAQQAVKSE